MPECDRCGETISAPRECSYCGQVHCSEHRLPESHECPGIENWERQGKRFSSGFDADG